MIRRPAPVSAAARRRRQLAAMLARRRSRQGGEVSAAKIGAVSALIGAVIGAAGAGVPAFLTTNAQINAEDSRVQAEFLREERKAAYSELFSAFLDFAALVQAHQFGEDDTIDANRLGDAQDELIRRVVAAQLVVPPDARILVDRLLDECSRWLNDAYSYDGPDPDFRPAPMAAYRTYNELVDLARRDFGVGS